MRRIASDYAESKCLEIVQEDEKLTGDWCPRSRSDNQAVDKDGLVVAKVTMASTE
jgi:hypothetical protein